MIVSALISSCGGNVIDDARAVLVIKTPSVFFLGVLTDKANSGWQAAIVMLYGKIALLSGVIPPIF